MAALAITELPYAIAVAYLGESYLEGQANTFVLVGTVVILLAVFMLPIPKRVLQR